MTDQTLRGEPQDPFLKSCPEDSDVAVSHLQMLNFDDNSKRKTAWCFCVM